MSIDQIRVRFEGGFRPFVLHLTDGRKRKIPHPEFILIGRDVVAVLRDDGLIDTIDPMHIVSIDDMAIPAVNQ